MKDEIKKDIESYDQETLRDCLKVIALNLLAWVSLVFLLIIFGNG